MRIAASLAVIGALGTAGQALATGTAAADADRALRTALDAVVAQPDGPPGAYALVNRDGRVHGVSSGRARIGGTEVPGSGRRMRIASLTKAFTATTALSLVHEGLLSLDSTIGQVLPAQPVAWHAVTLRQLLQHTGGVPDFGKSAGFAKAVGASPAVAPPPTDLLAFVADKPLDFPPGSRFQYSNSGPIVVGLMIEAVTGRSYGGEVAARAIRPAALPRTLLPAGLAIAPPSLRGYAWDDGTPADVSSVVAFGGWGWASGGLVSTPSDVSRFVRRYVGGALVQPAERTQQFRFVPGSSSPPGPGTNAVGLGVFRYRTRCGTVYGHTGSILGYTQFMGATRDGRRSAVVSISTQVTPSLLPSLRRAFNAATCAAFAAE